MLSLTILFRKKLAPRLRHLYLKLKFAVSSRLPTPIPWNTIIRSIRATQSTSPKPILIRVHTTVWVAPRSQRASIAARPNTSATEDKRTPEMAEVGLSTFATSAVYMLNQTPTSESATRSMTTHPPASDSGKADADVRLADVDRTPPQGPHTQRSPEDPFADDLSESSRDESVPGSHRSSRQRLLLDGALSGVRQLSASDSSSMYRTASETGSGSFSNGSEGRSHKSFYAI